MFLQENYPRLITAEAEVVISFDGRNGLEVGCKNVFQSYVGTRIVPSLATSWVVLHFADFSTVSLISFKQVMFVLLYRRLNSPKHKSGLKFVWPTTRKLMVIRL